MNEPLYILERHKYGWAVKAPDYRGGIPLDSFTELLSMIPNAASALMDSGIANSIEAIAAMGQKDDLDKWAAEINERLQQEPDPELRWLRGIETGISSLTIFSALASKRGQMALMTHRQCSFKKERADTPHDAADFGRCYKLLKLFPEWENRLPEVAMRYIATTKWCIVANNWPDLKKLYEAGNMEQLTANLRACNA